MLDHLSCVKWEGCDGKFKDSPQWKPFGRQASSREVRFFTFCTFNPPPPPPPLPIVLYRALVGLLQENHFNSHVVKTKEIQNDEMKTGRKKLVGLNSACVKPCNASLTGWSQHCAVLLTLAFNPPQHKS